MRKVHVFLFPDRYYMLAFQTKISPLEECMSMPYGQHAGDIMKPEIETIPRINVKHRHLLPSVKANVNTNLSFVRGWILNKYYTIKLSVILIDFLPDWFFRWADRYHPCQNAKGDNLLENSNYSKSNITAYETMDFLNTVFCYEKATWPTTMQESRKNLQRTKRGRTRLKTHRMFRTTAKEAADSYNLTVKRNIFK
jgi:hypothetical protein